MGKFLCFLVGLTAGICTWWFIASTIAPHLPASALGGILIAGLPMFPAVLAYLVTVGLLTKLFFGRVELG